MERVANIIKTAWVKSVAFAFIICLLEGAAFGKSAPADTAASFHNSLQPGEWALNFGIGYSFTLSSFQGSVLSVKKQLTSREALQLGVSGSLISQNNGGSTNYNQADTLTYGSSQSGSNNGGSLQVNLQYIYYPNPDAVINFFFGGGPTFGYSWSRNGTDMTPFLPATTDSSSYISYPYSPHNDQTSWNAGVSASAGVEWFVTTYFSLHAQYGLSLTYNKSSYSSSYTYSYYRLARLYTTVQSTSGNSKGWQLNPASAMFGLSVYFK